MAKTTKVTVKSKEAAKKTVAKRKQKTSTKKNHKTTKKTKQKTFVLFRPFVAIGRYIKESWHELRQVRWPNRKTTWKMTAAMLVYCAIFLVFIVLLDAGFSLIFNNLFK